MTRSRVGWKSSSGVAEFYVHSQPRRVGTHDILDVTFCCIIAASPCAVGAYATGVSAEQVTRVIGPSLDEETAW